MIYIFQGRYIPDLCDLYDLYDLYDLAHHVVGREPYNLHDLGHVSWVGSVLHRSCTTSRNGRLGSIDDLDRDLSDLSVLGRSCDLSNTNSK